MYMDKIRVISDKIKNKIGQLFKNIKIHISFLKENNMAQAIDFFEVGVLEECKNRLKIILKLWPNDESAKYLLSIVYLISRDREKAIKILKTIKYYKKDRVEKMILMLEKDRIKKVIDEYIKSFSLEKVESEIDAIQI